MWVFSRQLIYSNNKCYIGTLSFTVCVDECNQWKGTSATIAIQASKKKMTNFINTNLHGYGRKIISDLSNFEIFFYSFHFMITYARHITPDAISPGFTTLLELLNLSNTIKMFSRSYPICAKHVGLHMLSIHILNSVIRISSLI